MKMGGTYSQPAEVESVTFPTLKASLPSMKGKTVAVTGCTSGTGFTLARVCLELGARVIMLNRASARNEEAKTRLEALAKGMVAAVPCDLTDFESVRAAGATLRKDFDAIDVLVNNAGVMGVKDEATKDGYDVQMQTNHLSHFLLTSEVWPLLQKAAELRGEARVVQHSSGARRSTTSHTHNPERTPLRMRVPTIL